MLPQTLSIDDPAATMSLYPRLRVEAEVRVRPCRSACPTTIEPSTPEFSRSAARRLDGLRTISMPPSGRCGGVERSQNLARKKQRHAAARYDTFLDRGFSGMHGVVDAVLGSSPRPQCLRRPR